VRRHFVRAGDANPAQLKYWTEAWLERIKNLYAAHEKLMSAWAGAAGQAAAAQLEQARSAWDTALAAIDAARQQQMAAPGLQEPAKKALATLDREWDGLAAHRDYPMVSLDNDQASYCTSCGGWMVRGFAGCSGRHDAGGFSIAGGSDVFPRRAGTPGFAVGVAAA
jgi:hypothetical protein